MKATVEAASTTASWTGESGSVSKQALERRQV
jgi:hypothetical protein